MKAIAIACALAILATASGSPSRAGTAADSTATGPPGPSPLERTLRDPDLMIPGHFLRDRFETPTTGYLTLSLDPHAMQWYTPPTRLDAMALGAGTAATVGMFLGAIGNTLGIFDEQTTWILTGSLAAAGAVAGGVRYEPEPTLRIRLGEH
jgi:hypothetical protein